MKLNTLLGGTVLLLGQSIASVKPIPHPPVIDPPPPIVDPPITEPFSPIPMPTQLPLECPATFTSFPTFGNLFTTTLYKHTYAQTSFFDCTGCNSLTTVVAKLGHGPVKRITKTKTEFWTVSTTVICSPTATYTPPVKGKGKGKGVE